MTIKDLLVMKLQKPLTSTQTATAADELIDMEQAIALLKTTRPTFYRWLRAGKIKGTRGAKLGNPYLRWAFGEAAVIGKRDHPLLHAYAQQLEAAHGKFKGNAILAHKLARAVYFMLKNGTGFDVEKLLATAVGGAMQAA